MSSTPSLDIVFKKDNDGSGNASNNNEYACCDVYLYIRPNHISSFEYVGRPCGLYYGNLFSSDNTFLDISTATLCICETEFSSILALVNIQ